MTPRGSASNLVQAMKDLVIEWQQTTAYWRDVKSQDFERTYLEPVPDHVARTKTVMEEIDTILRKVRKDCE